MQYHYIYLITCLLGSFRMHYYIGKRTSNKPPEEDTGYIGSGTKIKDYVDKYGKEIGVSIIKEIIEINLTLEENAEREKFWVGDLWETDPMCLNLKEGGECGHYDIEAKEKISKAKKGKKPWNYGLKGSYTTCPSSAEKRKKISEANSGEGHWLYGKNMSEEQKSKISKSMKGRKKTDEVREKMRMASQKKNKAVIAINIFNGEKQRFISLRECEKKLNLSQAHISLVLHNKRHRVGDYTFVFDNQKTA